MIAKIFYSWQSDTPAESGREFIRACLESAIAELAQDASLIVRPELDHDTQGVPGAPAMVATVLRKIDECAVFVGDVTPTFIRKGLGPAKSAPNPNVLIELGYALNRLGRERLLLLLNTDLGAPEELPFDLRGDRVIPFTAGEPAALEAQVKAALNLILSAAGLPADLRPRAEIRIIRIDRDIQSERHSYRLSVRVRNTSEAIISDWSLELIFPEAMIEPRQNYPIADRVPETDSVVMRQTEAKHSGPLHPGEERELLGIDYFIDSKLYERRRELFEREIVVSFFEGRNRLGKKSEKVRTLQTY
jgi:hypothetical protein